MFDLNLLEQTEAGLQRLTGPVLSDGQNRRAAPAETAERGLGPFAAPTPARSCPHLQRLSEMETSA